MLDTSIACYEYRQTDIKCNTLRGAENELIRR